MVQLHSLSIRLMDLSEVEREEILSQRMEEMQRLQDKRNLEQMHKAQRGDADSVSKAAKRGLSSCCSFLHSLNQFRCPPCPRGNEREVSQTGRTEGKA